MFKLRFTLSVRCTALPLIWSMTKWLFRVAIASSLEFTNLPTRCIASIPICCKVSSINCTALTLSDFLRMRHARSCGLNMSLSVDRTAALPLPCSNSAARYRAIVRASIRRCFLYVFVVLLIVQFYHKTNSHVALYSFNNLCVVAINYICEGVLYF